MITEHTDAVMALLTASPAISAYVSRADSDAPEWYVVLHPDQGYAEPTSLAAVSDWRTWNYLTTCVGEGPDQAQGAADKVERRLLDAVPTVAGRSCGPIRKVSSIPVERDESVQPPVFIARDLWSFFSIPQ